ncbi:MAG: energy-coupling factor transporter transmembrane component T [Bacillota bacterium]|nr:energy-coupling factor transporter transmembrane component T [Bacillota bacterium]
MSDFNPNPGTKFVVLIVLSLALMYDRPEWANLAVIFAICVFFVLNGKAYSGIKGFLIYGIFVSLFQGDLVGDALHHIPAFFKVFFSVFMMFQKFFPSLFAGAFLIATSDVSSILAVMNKLRFPNAISIPFAVMFRFFPTYREERKNIKLAMKMRGITWRHPLKYLEYVMVPLLISSSNIADDISKSAETKCIADPGPKTKYTVVRMGTADYLYLLSVLLPFFVGILSIGGVHGGMR